MGTLHLDVLPSPQQQLWHELDAVPEEFVLYGGTAIALQLGHRQSIDLNFFARRPIDPERLLAEIGFLSGARPLQLEANTLTALVDRGDAVQLSFFGVPRLPVLRPPLALTEPRIRIADLLELAGMKCLDVQKRAEAKDYLDLHALLTQAGLTLPQMLAAGLALYGTMFAPEITLKSLCIYGDGNLQSVPHSVRSDLARAVRNCDPLDLPTL